MEFVSRQISIAISELINKYPVLAVTGPRQSGKTTLLKNLLLGYRYLSLEDADVRSYATDDPVGFLKEYDQKVIFDEVQRVPHLLSYIQTRVDDSGQMGQYVLSGSQNFHLLQQITQSLAGRVAMFKLLPFDNQELVQADLLPDNWRELLIKGFYPAIYDRDLASPIFYANYLETYVRRDLSELIRVQDMKRFNTFIGLCAGRSGQLLNLSSLANECGISQPTAKSWLSTLESSYIIFLLNPYFENFNKRIVKSPKLYFYDTGLLSYLLGYRDVSDLDEQSVIGNLFENMIVSELLKQNHHQYQLREYWFWRDSHGNEIDVLTRQGNRFDIFEIKSTQTIMPKLMKGMNQFAEISGRVKSKTLIYGGDEKQDRSEIKVRSWRDV